MKTKQLLGWVAMATMALGTSCSNDEVVDNFSPENAIQFGTYVGRDANSRGTVITTGGEAVENGPKTTDALTTKGFGVFAYYTGTTDFANYTGGPNFMYNQKVTGTTPATTDEGDDTATTPSIEWTYSPVKYWPNTSGEMVTFFAYAPYHESTTATESEGTQNTDATKSTLTFSGNSASGAPKITYTVGTDVKGHQDLLWAAPVVDQTKQGTKDKVKFTFKHALSRIGFKVQAMVDKVNDDDMDKSSDNDKKDDETAQNGELAAGTSIIIKKVTMSGFFQSKGTLEWEDNDDEENNKTVYTAKVIGKTATEEQNYVLGVTTSGEGSSTTITESNFASAQLHGKGAFDTKTYVAGQDVTTTEAKLNADDSYIMIIPRSFEGDNKVTISVEYDVITEDGQLSDGYIAITNNVSTKFNFNFKAGEAYTFSLHLGMTSVKLEATVDGWDDGGEWAVNVPLNETTTQTGASN